MSIFISKEYLKEQRRLHDAPKGYGGKGSKWAQVVIELAEKFKASSILDYGCGQGSLAKAVKPLKMNEYDPAISGKNILPIRADLVVCTDVLEHIEPDKLQSVKQHLLDLSAKALFLVVATRPASKMLSDGRNAHLTIEPAEWWEDYMADPAFFYDPAPPISPSLKPSREWVSLMVRK